MLGSNGTIRMKSSYISLERGGGRNKNCEYSFTAVPTPFVIGMTWQSTQVIHDGYIEHSVQSKVFLFKI